MSRLHKFFGLSEMARTKGEPIKATLDWASQQKGTFTITDLYKVYLANGGRANSEGENLQSFTTQITKMIARDWKDGEKAVVSDKRPIQAIKRGGRGGANPHILKWGLGRPYRSDAAKFVNPDDDNNSGEAMDRLEKALSRMGPGLPADPKVGRQKLTAAVARWKGMKKLDHVVADIRATIPKAGQMDALHIASEFLMGHGTADEDDVEDAEQKVAPPPAQQADDDDDFGEFSDEEPFVDDPEGNEDEYELEPDEEPEAPAPKAAAPTPPPTPKASPGVQVRKSAPPPPPPEPDDEDEEEDDGEAGAASFIKQAPPPPPPAKKGSVSKWFKR